MRALLTAVIAAIEAAAVALAVFAAIGVPAVLIWWLGFGFGAEPMDLAAAVAALWQMAHLVPMEVTVSAQAALALGLTPAEITFTLSLAPLTLTIGTMLLAYRSGARSASRGGAGAWALIGGTAGFVVAAATIGVLAADFTVRSQLTRIAVPTVVYAIPLLLGFVLRAAREDHDWWGAAVRVLQQGVSRFAPTGAAALPDRAAEVFRLTAAALAALLMLGTLSFAVAIVGGYVDIITLSQGLQLDVFGVLMLFVLQLAFLPTAWMWAISWFAGSGFAVGSATSVTPFDTLLGPLPVLPLFGAIPSSWGWAGGFAPVIIVMIGTVLGGLAGGRPLMRRASSLVSAMVPVFAAVLAGLAVAIFCVLASGSIGPGRLEINGPGWWQTGGLVALELAFGMSLGVFARRFDVARLRTMVSAGLVDLREKDLQGFDPAEAREYDQDFYETVPIEPLQSVSEDFGDDQSTVEVEPLDPSYSDDCGWVTQPVSDPLPTPVRRQKSASESEDASQPKPEQAPAAEPELTPESTPESAPEEAQEPTDAVDPLVKAFSWGSETPDPTMPETGRDWRSRLRSKWGRE